MAYSKSGEMSAEFDALRAGLEWVLEKYTPDDTTIQVVFCGAQRDKCKKIMENGEVAELGALPGAIPIPLNDLIQKFVGVSYYSSNRASGDVNLYDMSGKIFGLLYGESDFNHEVTHKYTEDGIEKQVLVGQPELRWYMGAPPTLWEWS